MGLFKKKKEKKVPLPPAFDVEFDPEWVKPGGVIQWGRRSGKSNYFYEEFEKYRRFQENMDEFKTIEPKMELVRELLKDKHPEIRQVFYSRHDFPENLFTVTLEGKSGKWRGKSFSFVVSKLFDLSVNEIIVIIEKEFGLLGIAGRTEKIMATPTTSEQISWAEDWAKKHA